MIADASVWIDYQRGGKTASTLKLRAALKDAKPVFLLPVVLQEVLQGAHSPEWLAARLRLFRTLPCLAVADAGHTAADAAALYAQCRWSGFTPRSGNDCLIAVSCIELGRPLLHIDRDFERIARVAPRLRFA